MSKLFFKFNPCLYACNEFSSDEELIGAYLEGIRLLLGGNELKFNPSDSEDSLTASFEGNSYQVSSLRVKDGEWDDTIIDLTLQSENGEQKVCISKEMIDVDDAWKLMTVVFEKMATKITRMSMSFMDTSFRKKFLQNTYIEG